MVGVPARSRVRLGFRDRLELKLVLSDSGSGKGRGLGSGQGRRLWPPMARRVPGPPECTSMGGMVTVTVIIDDVTVIIDDGPAGKWF